MPTITNTQQPFQRVLVDYMVVGTARITWTFNSHFADQYPSDWVYQLQVSTHGPLLTSNKGTNVVRTDDWINVGSPALNVYQLTDTTKRSYGKSLLTSYRVVLTTANGVYYSPPATSLGALNKQDWLRAREIIRKEELLHKKATSVPGFIFRRKRTGTPCTKCIDKATGEITLSKCDVCKGTHFVDGYFAAFPSMFCRLENNTVREHRDIEGKGNEKQDTTSGRISAVPSLVSYDIWVDGQSDLRYYVHSVNTIAKIRNVPLIHSVELRQAPFDDIAYKLGLGGS